MRLTIAREKSLTWRLATVYGSLPDYTQRINICTYMSYVLVGLVVWLSYCGIACMTAVFFADFFAWVAAGLMTSFVHPDSPALIVAAAFSVISVVFVYTLLHASVLAYQMVKREKAAANGLILEETEKRPRKKSALGIWWMSLRQKTCFVVDVE